MNPVLEQIYATILPSAPYVIAAYALMWLALCAYVVYACVRARRVEAQLAALEGALERGTVREAERARHDGYVQGAGGE